MPPIPYAGNRCLEQSFRCKAEQHSKLIPATQFEKPLSHSMASLLFYIDFTQGKNRDNNMAL